LSNKVYSFTKVEKRLTKSGEYALAVGIISLGVLFFFIGFGIYKNGTMSGAFCLIPYVTMIASIVCAVITRKDQSRIDVAGKCLYAGYRVCAASTVCHIVIFLIGILKVIL
jgi:hypothetical protein